MGLKRPRGGRQLGPQEPKWKAPPFPKEGGRIGVGEESNVPPKMRLYLPRVEARLRGIIAFWYDRKKVIFTHSHVQEQRGKIHSWLTIATSHNA